MSNLAANLGTWYDNHQLQDDKNQLVRFGRHFVAHKPGDLDNCELIQAPVAEQVIELGVQNGGACIEEAIREMESIPGRNTARYSRVPQDLKNGVSDVLDVPQYSIRQVIH